ncbi:MAG: DUF4857 domain-containing protein [Rikenellaceae bacterium]
MKHPNRLLVVITLLTTIVLLFSLPQLVRKVTISKDDYPFVYYSSKLREIAIIDYSDKQYPMQDLEGKKYSTAQFDTLLPLLNYRQLMSDGIMPDSIEGFEVTPRILAINSVVFRYNPRDYATPKVGIYALLECMPTRVGLTAPTDFFRIDDRIEFIDAATNRVDSEKSEKFQKAMLKQGYEFPTQWVRGDANTRKSYDEGYFCLDNKGDLYHLKMVNGRPFVRNTMAADSIEVAQFINYLPASKRFYGVIVSKEGLFYLLESDDMGGYVTRQLDIDPIDIDRDQMLVMGNLLYWNIAVTNSEGRLYYTLAADDLQRVATHSILREANLWDRVSQWLFPIQIEFERGESAYIYGRLNVSGYPAWILSILLSVVCGLVIYRRENIGVRLFITLLIAVSGLAGYIAVAMLPRFRK